MKKIVIITLIIASIALILSIMNIYHLTVVQQTINYIIDTLSNIKNGG
jgi:uncharacterized protein YoxC